MADKLIFPIGFDLEAAVKEAQGDAPKLLRRLQTTINSKPLAVNLRIDTEKGSIDEINSRMRELVKKWNALSEAQRVASKTSGEYTAEAKKIIEEYARLTGATESYARTLQQIASAARQAANQQEKNAQAEQKAEQKRQQAIAASLKAEYKRIEAKKQAEAASRRELEMLNRQYAAEERRQRLAASEASVAKRQKVINTLRAEENTIVNITAKLQHWQKVMNSSDMNGKQFKRATEEVQRLSQKLSEAQARIDRLTGKTKEAAIKQTAAINQVSEASKNQDGYISRLLKRMAVYAGYSAIGTFLTNVREVTAQFELQRVSLGAIIQDQQRANQLFSEIKAFALKSPVSILDLTKYTKQLAAYKIGVDELFETTKKLTDVSVGLGVSMDRVVLAYGQTRATGYLRASEIRQFTEMGVPIVEELASKLSKMNGELVTAAQVMDMVSKRAISFDLVKEVFDDMTSAGGMFYNMQEKQGNTLYGMWAKMGDAASVMYDQIGNTDSVNITMKTTIQAITDLMKHWRFWGKLIAWSGGLYLANVVALKILRGAVEAHTAAGVKNIAMSKAKVTAAMREIVATKGAGTAAQWGAKQDLLIASAKLKAATATNVFSKSLYSLWAAFLSNPLGWAIIAVTTLVALFADADDSAKQFAQSLGEIEEKYALKSLNDADNFKRLADAAVSAAEGSKMQREKLEELDRTYGQIVGSENLQIDKLRAMNGEYQSLIDTIEEYNIKMKYSEREGAIKEYYGGRKKDAFGKFEDELSTIGFFSNEVGHEQGAAIAINIQNALLEELAKNGKATAVTANQLLRKQLTNVFKARGKSQADAEQWANTIIGRLSPETDKFVESLNSERNALDENNRAMEEASGKTGQLYADIRKAKEELDKINYTDASGKALDTNSFLYQQTAANEAMKKAVDVIRNSQELKDALGDKAKELEPQWLHLVDSVSEDDLMDITTINFDAILKIIGDKSPELKRRIEAVQKEWGNIAPTNETALQIRQKLFELSQSFDPTLQKMKRFLWDGSGEVDEYLKRLKEQQETLKAQLKAKQATLLHASKLTQWWNKLMGKDVSAEIKQLENEIAALDQLIPYVTEYTNPKDKGNGRQSDPRLNNLKEEISLTKKLYDEYKKLEKQIGATKAAEKIQSIYANTIKTLQGRAKKYGFTFKLPFTDENLKANMQHFISKMKELQKLKDKKGKPLFPNIGKDIDEAVAQLEDVDFNSLQKSLEKKLKDLSDRISRTKTAKEFYDKILSQTGDMEMAANVTMSIYGNEDGNIQELLARQIQEYFGEYEVEIPIIAGTDKIDYKRVRELAKAALDAEKIGKDAYDALDKIVTDGEKDLSKIAEQGTKLLLKFDEIAQQRVNIEQEASEKIRQLREAEAIFLASNASEQEKNAYKKRTDKAVAGVEADRDLGLLKLKDEYLRFFSAIHSLTNKEAETLRTQVRQALFKAFQSGAISADQLKKELRAVDEQFRKLKDDSGMAMDYLKGGFDGLIQRVRDTADELQSVAAEISKMESPDQISEGQKSFINKILGKFGNESTGKSFADLFSKAKGDTAQMAGNLQNCAEGMEGMAEGAASTLAIVDRIITDVARTIEGVAAIRDQLNEMRSEDNQLGGGFWDAFEYLENFNKYAAKGWEDLKSGNVVGAVQNTVQSIISIFGTAQTQRVRKANKEIKRQQELLDQLEYTYSRLEKAAEKVFGADYINNFQQQQKNLQAQQLAYEKQLQAEKSKGKKADNDKIKEYEEKIREVKDEIADMQSKISEKMLGTDLASAARDFAKAWLDAYKEVGRAGAETSKAMKEKFQNMVQNMVVEGAMAAVMEKALQPMFKMIDEMNGQDFYSETFWKKVADVAAQGAEDADKGAQTLMKFLEQAGISMKDINAEYTGIKRDIASASEESINGLAAGINTQNYYVSHLPGIAANVALIRQLIESGNASTLPVASATGWTDWQKQAMDNYIAIQKNTYDTAVRCERAAIACETMVTQLRRVIIPKGSTAAFGVQVYLPK